MTETTIRPEFIEIAKRVHGGRDSILYGVASTGRMTLDGRRPMKPLWNPTVRVYHHEPMTDEEWSWTLWDGLASELAEIVDRMDASDSEDRPEVMWFLRFSQREANRIESNHSVMI